MAEQQLTIQNTKELYNKFKSQSLNYIITYNKKKNNYIVKDGFIKYVVIISPEISCQCNKIINKYCNHILYILTNELKLSEEIIMYIDLLKSDFYNLYNEKLDIELGMQEVILRFTDNEDCGICLNKLFNKELYQCIQCKKCAHLNCVIKWKLKKKTEVCMYCNHTT